MISRSLFLFFFAALTSADSGADTCSFECQERASLYLTQSGFGKLASHIVKNNKALVLEQGQFKRDIKPIRYCSPDRCYSQPTNLLDNPECFIMPTETRDPKTAKSTSEFGPGCVVVEGLQVEKLGFDLPRPMQCQNFRCQADIAIKKFTFSGKVGFEDRSGKKKIGPLPILFQLDPKRDPAKPIVYHYAADLSPHSGRLNDLVRSNNKQSNLLVPSGAIKLSADLRTLPHANRQWSKASALNYKKIAQSNHLNDPSNWNRFLTKELLALQKEFARKHPQMSNAELKKLMAQAGLSVEALQATNIRRLLQLREADKAGAFMLLPSFSKAESDGYLESYAKMHNVTVEQATLATGSIALVNLLAQTKALENGLPEQAQFLVRSVNDSVNEGLSKVEETIKNFDLIPDSSLDDLIRLQEINAELASIKDRPQVHSAIRQRELEKQREIVDDRIQNSMRPIQERILVEQASEIPSLIRMGLVPNSCVKPSHKLRPRAAGDENYDVSVDIGMDYLNETLAKMHKDKKFKFCVGGSKSDKCEADGVLGNFATAPVLRLGSDGKYRIRATSIELEKKFLFNMRGVADTEFTVEPSACNGSLCLKLTDPKASVRKALFLHFGEPAKRIRSGILSASNYLENQGIDMPFNLKKSSINSNGSLRLDFEL